MIRSSSALPVGDLTRLRLFVQESEAFVTGVEVDPSQIRKLEPGDRFHKLNRLPDRLENPVIFTGGASVADKLKIPVLGVMKIGKASVREGANEIEGEGSPLVSTQE